MEECSSQEVAQALREAADIIEKHDLVPLVMYKGQVKDQTMFVESLDLLGVIAARLGTSVISQEPISNHKIVQFQSLRFVHIPDGVAEDA